MCIAPLAIHARAASQRLQRTHNEIAINLCDMRYACMHFLKENGVKFSTWPHTHKKKPMYSYFLFFFFFFSFLKQNSILDVFFYILHRFLIKW